MKTLLALGISIAVAIALMFALREYMPGALLIVGGAVFVIAYVAKSINADPQRGWPTLAVFATVGFMLAGFYAVVGAPWLVAIAAAFFLGLAIFSAVKWARLGKTANDSGGGGRKFDGVAEAHELSRSADIERRRRNAQAELNQTRLDAVQTDQKIRDLEAANAALSRKVAALERDLDAAVNDPCFDQASHPLYKHV